jgi:hypothetical protein
MNDDSQIIGDLSPEEVAAVRAIRSKKEAALPC